MMIPACLRPVAYALCFALCALPCSFPARAAGDPPPGFLAGDAAAGLTRQDADIMCKRAGGMLPAAAQLQELADGSGDASFARFGWPAKAFWTRESSLGRYYAVSMDSGNMDLFAPNRLNAAVCGYGAAAPRKAAGALPGFATGVAPASMHYGDAARWCERKGRKLPQAAALKAVAGGTGDASYKKNEWPEGMFWTREAGDGGHTLVHLGNGKEAVFPDSAKNWVTCTD